MVLGAETIPQVSAPDSCDWDRRSCKSLFFSSDTGDAEGGASEPAEESRGTRQYHHDVGFPLTSTSCEESPEGHSSWGYHHSHRCYGRIWSSQSRPRVHPCSLCQFPSKVMTPRSKHSFDEHVYREPPPSETRSKTSFHVYLNWKHVLRHPQVTWKNCDVGAI